MANRKAHSFELLVSEGHITGHSFVHEFGAVPAMSQSTTGTIWDINDTLYPWNEFLIAGTLTVDRDAPGDSGKIITVEGLDVNFLPISEDITLTNPTGNAGIVSFIRVTRAVMLNGFDNIDNLTIKKSGTTVAQISAGQGRSMMAIYTVPAGKTGYLYKGDSSAEGGADGTGNVFLRYSGQAGFRNAHSYEVTGNGGKYEYNFPFPLPLPEKSDLDVRMTTRANNGRYTAMFDMLLVDN